jgi:periplasmic protein TonB
MAVPWRGLAASVALHGALLLALIVRWPAEPQPESLPAEEAVTVSFFVPAGNPDSAAQPETPLIEEIKEVRAPEEVESIEPEATEAIAPDEVTAAAPELAIVPEPAPLPLDPVAPSDVATLPPAETADAAEPKPMEAAPRKAVEEPATDLEQPAEKNRQAIPNALPPKGAEPKPATTASSGDPKYDDILLAWLQQKLIYPAKAERRGIEGTVLVRLVIDSTGRVLDYQILKSSGHRILDREVEALIERADPMPPVPEGERAPSLVFTIPVNFDLK